MTTPSLAAKNLENLSIIAQVPSSIVSFVKSAYDIAVMPGMFFQGKVVEKEKTVAKAQAVPEIFITQDVALLNQYYKLRDEIFKSDRGWTSKDWFENDFDKRGKIIVATENGKVIGGARIMVSTNNKYLSGEIEGTQYTYRNLFVKMNLNPSYDYGEIDGLIVDKNHRDRSVTEKILDCCIKYSLDQGCAYLIGIALPAYCRIYRSAYKAVGYDNVHIVKYFVWTELKEYNYSKDYPIVNIIRPNNFG